VADFPQYYIESIMASVMAVGLKPGKETTPEEMFSRYREMLRVIRAHSGPYQEDIPYPERH
jgi:hypothetical protein